MAEKPLIVSLPEGITRVETGAVQFGGQDWPGVFIRGDTAFAYSVTLKHILDAVKKIEEKNGPVCTECFLSSRILDGLQKLLASCEVKHEKDEHA